MKFLFPHLIILNFLIPSALAQEFIPGHILTLEGDTVKGFLLNGIDKELSLKTIFREGSADGPEKIYFPTDLLGFGFSSGRAFRQFTFGESDLSKTPKNTVFAKEVITGRVAQYVLERGGVPQPDIFLIQNKTGEEYHLAQPSTVLITAPNGKKYRHETEVYRGLMQLALSDDQQNYILPEKFKYGLKTISKEILKYNQSFQNDYMISVYKPIYQYNYNFTAGYSIIRFNEMIAYIISFYRHRHNLEKSRKWTTFKGISFKYAYPEKPWGDRFDPDKFHDGQYFYLSILPIGYNFHSESGFIRPYAFLGFGIDLVFYNSKTLVNNEVVERKSSLSEIFPAIILGTGIKMKIGSDYFIAELAPKGIYGGIFLNIGYSF